MGNCLKEQLRTSVNNDNLERFEALRITIHHKDGVSKIPCNITFLDNLGKMEVDGDGYMLNSLDQNLGQEYNVTNTDPIYFSNPSAGETYHAFFYKKYNLRTVNDGNNPISMDVSSLNYSDRLVGFIKRYEGNEDKGVFKAPSSITQINNSSTRCDVDLSNANATLTKIHGYYTIPQNVFNAIAPTLVEFDMGKAQSYLPDAALVGCAIEQGSYTDILFTWGTKTGSVPRLVNVNLGDKVDACLKNLANLTTGANTIVLLGTSNHETDPEVQAAINTLKTSKGVTNLQINGVPV